MADSERTSILLRDHTTSCTPEQWGNLVLRQHGNSLWSYPRPQGKPGTYYRPDTKELSYRRYFNRYFHQTDAHASTPYQFCPRDIARVLPPWVITLTPMTFRSIVRAFSFKRDRVERMQSRIVQSTAATPQPTTPDNDAYWDWRQSQLADHRLRREQERIAAFVRSQAREAILASVAPPEVKGKGSRAILRAMRTINTPNRVVIEDPQPPRLRIAKGTIANPKYQDTDTTHDIESTMRQVDTDLDRLIRAYQEQTPASELNQWVVLGSQPEHGTLRPLEVKATGTTRKQAEYLAGRIHATKTGIRTSVTHRSLRDVTITRSLEGMKMTETVPGK